MNEFNPQASGIITMGQKSDLTESFKELNNDVVEDDGFSSIDMRTRLTASQIPSLAGLDVLSKMGVYPKEISRIGRSVKRLAVSLSGKGRQEMVDITRNTAEKEAMAGKSLIERSSGE